MVKNFIMEIPVLFRTILKAKISERPRGAQSKLADKCNIPRTLMSDFLAGRKPLSEDKRARIAKELGYEYGEFLTMGRRLLSKEEPEVPQPSTDQNIDLETIKALDKSYVKSIAKMVSDLPEAERKRFQEAIEEKIRVMEMEKELKRLKKTTEKNGPAESEPGI